MSKPRPPIPLANGKLVTHHLMLNGAQEARINGVPEMSESEWTEYCAKLHDATLATIPVLKLPLSWTEVQS